MKNYVSGGDTIVVPAIAAALASGKGFLVGALFGVANADYAIGDDAVLNLEGVYTLDKATGAAWTQGALLYWDATNKVVTTTSSGNTKIGAANAAAASGDALGDVRLNGAA